MFNFLSHVYSVPSLPRQELFALSTHSFEAGQPWHLIGTLPYCAYLVSLPSLRYIGE